MSIGLEPGSLIIPITSVYCPFYKKQVEEQPPMPVA